jgi:biotin carboxyl carrier protein
MTQSGQESIAQHVARLAQFLVEEDLESVRIERPNETYEVGRTIAQSPPAGPADRSAAMVEPRVEQIASDRVGIFHFSRPSPFEGERIEADRELGYVEQLGIRNAVRSRGPGLVRAVLQHEGDLVDYGRPLFEIERG